MNPDTYKHYLRDLIYLIKEREAELKSDTSKSEFNKGVECGYSEIISLIENQAFAFDLELKEIGFNDFEKFINDN
ncbi:hypothetical protein JM658_16895 [Joostella atrarenae]|uniref:Uncharacterized protein n=1 Tax=Joostella atrarenae TaxID=679257 RepID=A0ABS9J7W7_9FLAO|nr:hypothetical protein [Joostella atrarenae]MCF8716502.1 hypothetical protein [Joostella atrarenae]